MTLISHHPSSSLASPSQRAGFTFRCSIFPSCHPPSPADHHAYAPRRIEVPLLPHPTSDMVATLAPAAAACVAAVATSAGDTTVASIVLMDATTACWVGAGGAAGAPAANAGTAAGEASPAAGAWAGAEAGAGAAGAAAGAGGTTTGGGGGGNTGSCASPHSRQVQDRKRLT